MSFPHHPSKYPAVPHICIVVVLPVTTMTDARSSDRVLGATGNNCLLSLVIVNPYIGFAATRKLWVLKVIVDRTRTQFTLLEGYRCEGHLGSRPSSSCTLSSLSTVETHTVTTAWPPRTSKPGACHPRVQQEEERHGQGGSQQPVRSLQ